MEVDGSGICAVEGTGGGGGGGVEKKNNSEGRPKPKRKTKTAAQLEILEKTYATEAYPSEALRAELSVKLGLSDRQLQMWFCHRRLKDRKAPTEKRVAKDASPGTLAGLFGGSGDEVSAGHNVELGCDLSLGTGTSRTVGVETHQQQRAVHRPGTALARIRTEMPAVKGYYKPPDEVSELGAISSVESQLGERLREDGPILGMEFDPLPPGAFGMPIVAKQHKKSVPQLYEAPVHESPDAEVMNGTTKLVHEYQFLPERPSIRDDIRDRAVSSHSCGSSYDLLYSRTPGFSGESFMLVKEELMPPDTFQDQMPGVLGSILPQLGKQGQHMPLDLGEVEIAPQRTSFSNSYVDANCSTHPIAGVESPFISSERQLIYYDDRIERKRKSEEASIARELQVNEKRIRKELEKQDLLQRKREEQMRKEMERQDKERRKEEERLSRERQREQERYEREQKREMERREKFLEKESAEKMRLKEEIRQEKEAARLKAANDRATARRVAKEPAELLDDDCVELMELVASSLNLPSALALDRETLHYHEALRDRLSDFPPKTVHLKIPFPFRPWTDSEERVGCLLMVWKFLITFADVLGLWPCTLDEILQAFHDHDSRLLGEIHIALLKTIIKDIEDVARTPPNVLGTNPNLAANHGGGHPQIVEGAYAWGFDVQSWKQHLNPLTWPEIMRQFALSAGFGSKLKTRSMEQIHIPDENEGKDGSKIISDLRDGTAAKNAFARMRRRGLSNFRKSLHRLTPGTVKYAAFHILSLEGDNGLTILEVAEKIQKSGLRDLTTSKTPEASISAALSRDTKLFERTAPSTYCVRTPYRKDPADADVVLAAAREKVQVCKNEILDTEEAYELEKNGERDEDSECDLAEDLDVDKLGTELNPENEVLSSEARNENGIKNSNCDLMELQHGHGNIVNSSNDLEPKGLVEEKDDGFSIKQSASDLGDKEVCIIDDTNSGELWVHGLMEGEYSDLSVDERLDALTALICVVNEGNSVRVVLEERLEAANVLKKQLWTGAQFDKRRIKEEFPLRTQYSYFGGNKVEPAFSANAVNGRQSHYDAVYESNEFPASTPTCQNENFEASDPAARNSQTLDSCNPEKSLPQQSAYAAEKTMADSKYYVGHRAEEVYVYKSLPLGQDRRRNRYWQFIASPSQYDPGAGRIFVELRDGRWRLIDSVEDFDALVAALDVRGIRESNLNLMLRKIEFSFKKCLEKSLLCSDFVYQKRDDVKRDVSEECPKSSICFWKPVAVGALAPNWENYDTLKRYRHFEKWMWEECFNCRVIRALKYWKTRRDRLVGVCEHCYELYFLENHHCPFCHQSYSNSVETFCFVDHINQCKEIMKDAYDKTSQKLESSAPFRIRLLKAQLASLEASVPPEAQEFFWSEDLRRSWTTKLQNASSAEDLLQMLTVLEGTVKRDFLKENYETTSELLGSGNVRRSTTDEVHNLKMIAVLPWVPPTTSAIALKLMELDASICYMLCKDENSQREEGSGNIVTTPHRAARVKSESQLDRGTLKQDMVFASGGKHNSYRQRNGVHVGRSERTTKTSKEKFGSLSGWKSRPRGRGSKRNRQAAKSKRKPVKRVLVEKAGQRAISNTNTLSNTPDHKRAGAVCCSSERSGVPELRMEDLDCGTAEEGGNNTDGDEKDDNVHEFEKKPMDSLNEVLECSSSDYSDY